MRRSVIFLVTAMFIFGVVQAASAGWGGGPGKLMLKDPVNMVDELKLSDEQAAKIREIQEAQFKEMTTLHNKQRQAVFELRQQSFTPGVKQEQLKTKAGEIEELWKQKQALAQKYRDQVRGVLTDEQLKLWPQAKRGGPCVNPDGPMAGPMGGRGAGTAQDR